MKKTLSLTTYLLLSLTFSNCNSSETESQTQQLPLVITDASKINLPQLVIPNSNILLSDLLTLPADQVYEAINFVEKEVKDVKGNVAAIEKSFGKLFAGVAREGSRFSFQKVLNSNWSTHYVQVFFTFDPVKGDAYRDHLLATYNSDNIEFDGRTIRCGRISGYTECSVIYIKRK